MWKLMICVVNAAEMRVITGQFVVSAILQSTTLAFMIPFLRALHTRSGSLTGWLVAVMTLDVVAFVVDAVAMFRSYRVSVFEICDTMIDRVAEHILALPLGWFNAKRKTAVINAISRGVNILSHLRSMVIPDLCNTFIIPLVMLVTVGIVEWPLALIMAVVIVPLYLMWRIMRLTTTRTNEVGDQAAAATAGRLVEFARLQPVLRATGVSRKGWRPVQGVLEAGSRTTLDDLRIRSQSGQSFAPILNTAFAVVLTLGLSSINGHQLDVVAYLTIIIVVARMLLPLTKGVLYASEVGSAAVAFKAIVSILGTKPLPGPSPEQVGGPKGTDIILRDVSFSYEEGWPVLDGVSLTAEQGRVTALIGPFGTGKSTVLRLATRFWDITAGTMSISDADVRHLPTIRIMAMTLMAFQEIYLFDTTVHENLRIAQPNATDEKLEEAARRASLDKVIEALPHGQDTPVGPDGVSLSGGERQQASITRAFLRDAPILLLDEITSALNGENESAITEVIQEPSRGRTVLVVAHRLSTIRQADWVVFLEPSPDDAQVTQAGTVSKLATQGGPFRDFVETYTAASR